MADPLVSLPAAQTALTRGGQAPTPSTAKWGLFVSFLKKGSVHKKKNYLSWNSCGDSGAGCINSSISGVWLIPIHALSCAC